MGLTELTAASNRYGANPDFVLAGGGNTSYKDDAFLYIKASGTTLADITEDGFVRMNRSALAQIWNKSYPEDNDAREAAVLEDLMDARFKTEFGKRPSVETSLHDLFPQSYVIHLHPAPVNGMTCAVQGKKYAQEIFPEAVWIPLIMPGYTLAAKVRDELLAYKAKNGCDAEIVFLENHGVFVAGDSIERIDAIYLDITKRLTAVLSKAPSDAPVDFDTQRAALLAPAVRMLLSGGNASVVTFRTGQSVLDFLADAQAFLPISSSFTPDHMVYCKAAPLYVKSSGDLEQQYQLLQDGVNAYCARFGFLPRIVAVEGLGYFAQGNSKKNADIAAAVFYDTVKIAVYSQSFGGHQFMPQPMIDFIASWEVESYRAKIGLAGAAQKRLHEKICIVTGSAQGFGQGIADEMIREGANMVIADLNDTLAEQNAAGYRSAKVIPARVDVSDEESVRQMLEKTVLEFGGLDVFVSNAGVLKAGGLDDMDVNSFDFVTKINYTAYFICVKYASKIMKLQNRFDKTYTADIIQINSKSGLAGSNKNFAYAGGKFGGVGLTQSFALELAEFGIKVNAICPGNYFEGPLWSDPERGLFVQYLRAGKVAGAKTVGDVKRFYESKVPLNRGCYPSDVAKALFYAVEQPYETGQAIPVTGGQNMLK